MLFHKSHVLHNTHTALTSMPRVHAQGLSSSLSYLGNPIIIHSSSSLIFPHSKSHFTTQQNQFYWHSTYNCKNNGNTEQATQLREQRTTWLG